MGEEYDILKDGRRIRVKTLPSRVAPKRRRTNHYIGCPLEWLKRVLPIVESEGQLAVAVWLHRRRAVCKRELFDVPNDKLREELGINRFIKHRALRCLEKAGAIAVVRNNKHALQVRILW
jgi:hypothetical protein